MPVKLDEKTKLMALAHIKAGRKPKEVADLLDISYSQALRLSKDLSEAERRGDIQSLFRLDEAALDTLIESAKSELAIPEELATSSAIEGELDDLRESLQGLDELDTAMQEAAGALTKRLKTLSSSATQPDTILMLARALSELRNSFFAKGANVSLNNFDSKTFEDFLSD